MIFSLHYHYVTNIMKFINSIYVDIFPIILLIIYNLYLQCLKVKQLCFTNIKAKVFIWLSSKLLN